MAIILGIESSCDESSASVVEYLNGRFRVLSLATFSQIQLHQPYGGVVPEIASRNHLETINQMIDQALKESSLNYSDLTAIAVTNRPGLVGALLVGVTAAKAIGYAKQIPVIPVHHLEGHALSPYLDYPQPQSIQYPMLTAIVSGGHTDLYVTRVAPEIWPIDFLKKSKIGRSIDDAAGEAFDKTAKLLGFPYPGGVWIEKTAKGGNPKSYSFPRALAQKGNFDFSFSGLKTAVSLQIQALKKQGTLELELSNLCASIQEAIVESLVTKIEGAARMHHCQTLCLAGGVAANARLREKLIESSFNLRLATQPFYPILKYCTDNAAMIAAAGAVRFQQGRHLSSTQLLELNAIPNPEY